MHDELKEFGLTENEIKIYVALLRLGNASPTEISQKTGLHRAYVYDALERLLEKGMVNFIFVNNRKRFQPVDPMYLVELAETKKSAIEKIIPEMQKIMISEKTDTKVEIHRGKGAFKTVLNSILLSCGKNNHLYAIGIDDDLYNKVEPVHLSRYFKKAKKMGIREMIISPKGIKPHEETKITEYRYLDKKYLTLSSTWIYADKVVILTMGTPIMAIIIQNKDISETYKKQFQLLWHMAEK